MRLCKTCGKELISKHRKVYCSKKCVYAGFTGFGNPMYRGAKKKSACKICNSEFEYYTTVSKGIYCSTKCSDICPDRISKMKKSKTKTFNGELDRVIKARIRVCPEYRSWRLSVFIRDNYKCLNCGSGKNIEAHHAIPFSFIYTEVKLYEFKSMKPFFDINNGETICRVCHELTETYGALSKTCVEKRVLTQLGKSFKNNPEGFDSFVRFYDHHLEKIIDHYKKKLP